MKVLVCNAGSTSLKFKLYEMPACRVLATGKVERVGSSDDAIFGYRNAATGYTVDAQKQNIPDYAVGINRFLDELTQGAGAVLKIFSRFSGWATSPSSPRIITASTRLTKASAGDEGLLTLSACPQQRLLKGH